MFITGFGLFTGVLSLFPIYNQGNTNLCGYYSSKTYIEYRYNNKINTGEFKDKMTDIFEWGLNLKLQGYTLQVYNNSIINVASSMMQDRTGPIDNNNVVLYHYPNTNDLFNVPNGTFNVGFYAEYCFQSGTAGIMSLSISPSYIGELKLVNI